MVTLYTQLMTWLNSKEEGQGMAEYALIIALVAIALIAALVALKGGISGVFSGIVSGFSGS